MAAHTDIRKCPRPGARCQGCGVNSTRCLLSREKGGGCVAVCTLCTQQGHLKKNCPRKGDPALEELRTCKVCGEVGHTKLLCPMASCPVCGEVGHSKKHCPNKKGPDPERRRNTPVACTCCGSTEHIKGPKCEKLRAEWIAEKCPDVSPEEQNERCDTALARTCTACGEVGHNASTCSKPLPPEKWQRDNMVEALLYIEVEQFELEGATDQTLREWCQRGLQKFQRRVERGINKAEERAARRARDMKRWFERYQEKWLSARPSSADQSGKDVGDSRALQRWLLEHRRGRAGSPGTEKLSEQQAGTRVAEVRLRQLKVKYRGLADELKSQGPALCYFPDTRRKLTDRLNQSLEELREAKRKLGASDVPPVPVDEAEKVLGHARIEELRRSKSRLEGKLDDLYCAYNGYDTTNEMTKIRSLDDIVAAATQGPSVESPVEGQPAQEESVDSESYDEYAIEGTPPELELDMTLDADVGPDRDEAPGFDLLQQLVKRKVARVQEAARLEQDPAHRRKRAKQFKLLNRIADREIELRGLRSELDALEIARAMDDAPPDADDDLRCADWIPEDEYEDIKKDLISHQYSKDTAAAKTLAGFIRRLNASAVGEPPDRLAQIMKLDLRHLSDHEARNSKDTLSGWPSDTMDRDPRKLGTQYVPYERTVCQRIGGTVLRLVDIPQDAKAAASAAEAAAMQRQEIIDRHMDTLRPRQLVALRGRLASYGADDSGTRSELLARLEPFEAARVAPPPGYSGLELRVRAGDNRTAKSTERNRQRFIDEQERSDKIRAELEPSAERYAASRARIAEREKREREKRGREGREREKRERTAGQGEALCPVPKRRRAGDTHCCNRHCTCDIIEPRCECYECRRKVRDPVTKLLTRMLPKPRPVRRVPVPPMGEVNDLVAGFL